MVNLNRPYLDRFWEVITPGRMNIFWSFFRPWFTLRRLIFRFSWFLRWILLKTYHFNTLISFTKLDLTRLNASYYIHHPDDESRRSKFVQFPSELARTHGNFIDEATASVIEMNWYSLFAMSPTLAIFETYWRLFGLNFEFKGVVDKIIDP